MVFAINSLEFIFLSLKLDNIVEWSWVVSALNMREVRAGLTSLCQNVQILLKNILTLNF